MLNATKNYKGEYFLNFLGSFIKTKIKYLFIYY